MCAAQTCTCTEFLADSCHTEFVRVGLNRKTLIYPTIKQRVLSLQVKPFKPRDGVRIAVTDAEAKEQGNSNNVSDDCLSVVCSFIPSPARSL